MLLGNLVVVAGVAGVVEVLKDGVFAVGVAAAVPFVLLKGVFGMSALLRLPTEYGEPAYGEALAGRWRAAAEGVPCRNAIRVVLGGRFLCSNKTLQS